MKVGDWVAHEDGRVGYVTLLNHFKGFHLVMFDDTFARATPHVYLTVIDPAVVDILTAVKTNEEK